MSPFSRAPCGPARRAMIAAAVVTALSGGACKHRPHRHRVGAAERAAAVKRAPPGAAMGKPASPDASPPVQALTPPRHASSPEISLGNLDGEIAEREKHPDDPDAQRELVGRYLMRSQFAGRIADLEAALAVSARLVGARGDDPRAHMTRAGALSAAHEFAAAEEELRRAADLHAAPADVARQRASILSAEGKEDEALALSPGPVDLLSPADLTMRGAVVARLGRPEESDALFQRAREHYVDTLPFAIAWMDFERARALEIAGERARARAYLLEAVTVLPGYAHAATHLAPQEPADRALARLQPLEATSDDPDVLAAEADALRRLDRPAEARATADRARRRYEDLLRRLPLAFADHAAWFFLGMGGDPGRALALARLNAQNRPNDESLDLWLTAAEAATSPADVCDAARRIAARPHAPAALRERATTSLEHCP